MANEIYDSTWWGNTIDTASSIGTSTEMIQGQFNMNKLGDNLVVNGNFDTNSDWNIGNGWSIGDGKVVFNDNANGDIRTLNPVFTASKMYEIKLTVSDLTSGTAFFGIGDGSPSNLVGYNNYTNGEHTFYVTAPNGNELRIYSTTSSGSSYSITNISVQQVRAYRPIEELVKNGDFATDSNWLKGTGWSIANGEAVALNSSNSNLEQIGLTVTNAKKYKINFTINNYTSGAVKPMLGTVGATTGTNVSANGTYTEVLTANNNYDRIAFRTSGTAFNGSIDNISVKQADQDEVEAKKCLADAIHRIGLQDIQN